MNKRPLSLEVMISTLGSDGIKRVAAMTLPQMAGVSYLVSWQTVGEDSDVRVIRTASKGLSRNRNHALDHASADVLLIADDDLDYIPQGLEAVRTAFEADPDLDIGLFRYSNGCGGYEKVYPQSPVRIAGHLPKDYYTTSMEIAIRREGRSGSLRFHEEFGLGAPVLKCGEEELFLLSARRAGHKIVLFPVDLCVHRGLTTGNRRVADRGVYRGMGAVTALIYPLTFLPRFVLAAWRGKKRGIMKFFPALINFIYGAAYMALRVRPFGRRAAD